MAASLNTPGAEKLLEDAVARKKPEAAVLLYRQGKTQYIRAFGSAGKESPFLIASITKPMTVTAVMQLADKGKLKLSDPVSRYLPGFREGIEIHHLLSHTSGLPDMLPGNVALRKRNAPLEDYVQEAITTPLLFPPGTKWSYSSAGILMASEVARRVDGRPIAKLVADEVFRPLGMKDSAFGLGSFTMRQVVRNQTEFATGDNAPSAWDWNSEYWRKLGAPWGGAHSTAADIGRFLDAFLHPAGKLLKPESIARMTTNQNPSAVQPYGFGWAVGLPGVGASSFGHAGSTGTLCWADPAQDKLFVLLTSLPDAVARKAIIQPVSALLAAR